jgi:hypothetical protein
MAKDCRYVKSILDTGLDESAATVDIIAIMRKSLSHIEEVSLLENTQNSVVQIICRDFDFYFV